MVLCFSQPERNFSEIDETLQNQCKTLRKGGILFGTVSAGKNNILLAETLRGILLVEYYFSKI